MSSFLLFDVPLPVLLLDDMTELIPLLFVTVDLVDHDDLLGDVLSLVEVDTLTEFPRWRKPLTEVLAVILLLLYAVTNAVYIYIGVLLEIFLLIRIVVLPQ
jgi:hypothetical protein